MSVLPIAIRTMNSGVATRRRSYAGEASAAVVLLGDGHDSPSEPDESVVLDRRILVPVPEQLHRRDDQQQPEQQEHERELRDECRSQS